jgi:endonuclease-3
MNAAKRAAIYSRLQTANPNPRTELKYKSPFELLVAIILSAQATDISVNLATDKLYQVANTPESIAALKESGLKKYIKAIGLYNSKARHIIQTCGILIEKYDGEVPQTRSELEALPGVGRKTASVMLNTAFGESTIAVDTHIFRLGNRTGLAPGKTPLEVEKKLMKYTPDKYKRDAHHWLILHGRYICKARKPECRKCIIEDLCEYNKKVL